MPGTAFARTRIKLLMRHRYTWRQRLPDPDPPPEPTDDVDEAWGVADHQYADPVSDKPCVFRDGGREYDAASGEFVNLDPTILIPWDDPANLDDIVDQVTDSEGHVLVQGPLRCMLSTDYAGGGGYLYRALPLRAAQAEG